MMISDDDPLGVDFTFTTPFFQTLCAPAAADYNPEDYFAHNDVATILLTMMLPAARCNGGLLNDPKNTSS